jgi:hypothetical protein
MNDLQTALWIGVHGWASGRLMDRWERDVVRRVLDELFVVGRAW